MKNKLQTKPESQQILRCDEEWICEAEKLKSVDNENIKHGGKNKMEGITAKPQMGAYANMQTDYEEREPVRWENVGESHIVVMKCHEPREVPSPDGTGVFYVFDCEIEEEGEMKEKAILTSAWSLLRGLKKQNPYMDKKLKISKERKAGKQHYVVEEVEEEA